MYLRNLDNEKKHLFLDLELLIANSDGNFDETEKAIIDYHCGEMHIDNNNYINELDFSEIMKRVKRDFSDEEKRIFFLELVAVVLADGKYHAEEKKIICKLSDTFGISEEKSGQAFQIINKLQEVYTDMNKFVKEY